MIQSMERKGVVDDRIIDYSFVIVDECHHVSAVSFERVLMQTKAKYILGLTATPYRKDGHQPIIHSVEETSLPGKKRILASI